MQVMKSPVTHLVRIPVRVKDNDGVGSLKVEAQAASAGGQQEKEIGGILPVEHLK